MIHIHVEDTDGSTQTIEIPLDNDISLMEVLRTAGYDIWATCGGMALCATCHIEILAGKERIPAPFGLELDMLDTLPDAEENSRLSCQIRIDEKLDGLAIRIKGA